MKRGFTLLELVVVIIIIGILATLGLTQYGRIIERSRGAEARAILGTIRTYAAAYRLENSTIVGVTATQLSIGAATDQIPGAVAANCRESHFFWYSFSATTDPTIVITATRCAALGKPPQGIANTLILTSDLSTGVDGWTGTGGY